MAERLLAPDMFSGWGIRTLSSACAAYNPMSYHNGSVWPHDNAIIAAGLKRYGAGEEAQRIAAALFDVATHVRDSRLPELFCGFDRVRATPHPIAYPVACVPQAWAAAAPLLIVQAMLGIRPTQRPAPWRSSARRSPTGSASLRLERLRVGDASGDARVPAGARRNELRAARPDRRGHRDDGHRSMMRPAPGVS